MGLSGASKPVEVFYSYSHKDEKLLDKLRNQLAILKHQGRISEWHDRKITAGQEWRGQIDDHLESAGVILLLVSANFLASGYCHDVEMKRALERHRNSTATVIPVILSPCMWETMDLHELNALPTDGKPVTQWRNRDEAYANIARGIDAAINQPAKTSGPTKIGGRALQEAAPLLCNRDKAEYDFYDFCLRMMDERQGAPQVYVISGDEYDGHSLLVKRLFHTRLKTISEQRRSIQKAGLYYPILRTSRPRFDSMEKLQIRLSRDLYEIAEELSRFQPRCAKNLAMVEKWKLHSFVVIEHDLDAGAMGSELGEFIRWYVDDFWADFTSAEPQFVSFLSLRLPRARSSWRFWEPSAKEKVESQLRHWFPGFPENAQMSGSRAAMLLNLGVIELADLEHWVEDREIYPSRKHAHDVARRIYDNAVRRSGGTVRMDLVYEELERFWREEGNAA